jgi:hypothetical protein
MAGSAAVLTAGLCTGLVAYYAGGFQAVSASAVATELRYVPADATLVAYADVRSIMDSELRMRLKESIPIHEQGQKEFQEATGIDIERDIDFVVAAMTPGASSTNPLKAGGLVFARGRFNDVQLESLARQHGAIVEEYKGKRMLLIEKLGSQDQPADNPDALTAEKLTVSTHTGVLAFLEPGLVAVGEAEAVKKAIDAQLTSQSVTSNDEMMQLVGEIGASNNAWAVGRFDAIVSQASLPDEIMTRLPPVKWFAAAGHINGGISGMIRAEARDDESAELLRKQLAGLLAFGQMAAGTDPRAKAMIDSLQMGGTGKTVSLSFTVPAEILQMIPQVAAQHH